MALGGGTFVTQDKVLPGAYINFVSRAAASSALSARGVVAMPMELDWCSDEVFTVTAQQFQKESFTIFGYDRSDEKLKPIRELFKNAVTAHLYKTNGGGVKASNAYAAALCTGKRGNDIMIAISENEAYTEENALYDVSTILSTRIVDTQTVRTAAELKANAFVGFISTATLTPTAGTPLTGGANGSTSNGAYQTFLDKIESYGFNAMGCTSQDPTIKALFVNFTKRMRDEIGSKFQCVLHQHSSANYEGVISVENNETSELVYWVTGAVAGCAVNASNTNKRYDGEYDILVDYTQSQLQNAIEKGKFIFHRVYDDPRVLEDINTLTSFTDTKNSDFANNQTMRVADQIANDIAVMFNTKYLGTIQNNESGRVSFWGDIVTHHQEMEKEGAIENFEPSAVTVERGDSKKSVVVNDAVTPINAMTQLYVSVVIG